MKKRKTTIQLVNNINTSKIVAKCKIKIIMPQETFYIYVSKDEAERCCELLQIPSVRNLRLPDYLIKLGYILLISKK